MKYGLVPYFTERLAAVCYTWVELFFFDFLNQKAAGKGFVNNSLKCIR